MAFTTIRPDSGLGNGRLAVEWRVDHAGSSISALEPSTVAAWRAMTADDAEALHALATPAHVSRGAILRQ